MSDVLDGEQRAVPEADAQWRRLTSRMLLIYPMMSLGRFLPVLLGIFFLGRSGGRGLWWVIGVGALVVVMAIIRWLTTRFRITSESIEVRSGLFRRQSISASVDRVRTVDVTSKLLHRLLGLAKVEIGTASAGTQERLVLDSLPAKDAQQLRAELLHGQPQTLSAPDDTTPTGPHTSADAAGIADAQPGTPPPDSEHLILRLNPTWIRYAPLTLSGLLTGAIIVGFAARLLNEIGANLGRIDAVEQTTQSLARMSLGAAVVLITLVLLLAVTLLSVAGYLLAFWRFRLSRHDGGTLHIARGLITTRATSIEERRLRGVELVEPLLLRWGRGARLTAITTGLRSEGRESNGQNGATLVPPAPRSVACGVGGDVLRDPDALSIALMRHGPAAARRRYSRTLLAAALLIALATLSWRPGLPPFGEVSGVVPLVSLVLVPVGILLARDRYRSLGHGLHDRYLVRRAGSLSRRTSVLHSDGIIGWNLRQSLFQRRSGLATLTATTAAGAQRYTMIDMHQAEAVRFGEAAVPGLLRQFLA